MCGSEWGGSEELWAEMAQRALHAGLRVSICLIKPRPHHRKLEALERAGADVFCRSEDVHYLRVRRFAKIAGFLNSSLGELLSERAWPLPDFFSTQPDVLLLSDGASIPPTMVIDAICKRYRPRPYVILSQANMGEIPKDRHRKQAAEFYRGAHSALFVSESNLRATERQLLQRLDNGRVVRNPVNLDVVDHVDWPDGPTFNLASVARLVASVKGQDILLEVLSARRWEKRDWRLSLYGSGEDKGYLEELAGYFRLSDRVSFPGHTEDIRGIWRRHHLLVMPSRFEGMPIAAVEAMLCARPVVATRVAGLPEWVRDRYSGFLAEAPSRDSFATALEAAWEFRSEWQTMGNNAKKDALRLYDPAPGDTLLSILIEAAQADQRTRHVRRADTVAPLFAPNGDLPEEVLSRKIQYVC
jgi:L-malate glycosyltransferase